MHVLENMSYELEDMIKPIVKKGDMTPTELDNLYKAVKTMYYAETLKTMKEYGNSNDYSYRGSSNGGSYDGSYENYSERRGRDARGRYTSREYSRDIMSDLSRMMNEAGTDEERQAIRECMRKLDK